MPFRTLHLYEPRNSIVCSITRILVSTHFIFSVLPIFVAVGPLLCIALCVCLCISHSFQQRVPRPPSPSASPANQTTIKPSFYIYRQTQIRILVYAKYFSRFDNCKGLWFCHFAPPHSSQMLSIFSSMFRFLSLPFRNTLFYHCMLHFLFESLGCRLFLSCVLCLWCHDSLHHIHSKCSVSSMFLPPLALTHTHTHTRALFATIFICPKFFFPGMCLLFSSHLPLFHGRARVTSILFSVRCSTLNLYLFPLLSTSFFSIVRWNGAAMLNYSTHSYFTFHLSAPFNLLNRIRHQASFHNIQHKKCVPYMVSSEFFFPCSQFSLGFHLFHVCISYTGQMFREYLMTVIWARLGQKEWKEQVAQMAHATFYFIQFARQWWDCDVLDRDIGSIWVHLQASAIASWLLFLCTIWLLSSAHTHDRRQMPLQAQGISVT